MPPSLLELKVLPSFWFAFKIPDDVAASNIYIYIYIFLEKFEKVEKIGFHLNLNFECNTEGGSKESLSIALGLEYLIW